VYTPIAVKVSLGGEVWIVEGERWVARVAAVVAVATVGTGARSSGDIGESARGGRGGASRIVVYVVYVVVIVGCGWWRVTEGESVVLSSLWRMGR